MLKETRTVRLKDLNPSEKRVFNELREGSKTVGEMATAFGVTYHAVKRPLESLESKGIVEEDPEESAFSRSKYWRIKRLPTDGIELEVRVRGELRTISFNTFLRQIANQIDRGDLPKIGREWRRLSMTVALLATYAAKEVEDPDSVTELQLLEIRSKLHQYGETLKEEYARVSQILGNEAFWIPKALANGAMKKTDLPLSPDDAREYARKIVTRFNPEMSQVEDDDTELELENDSDE